MPLKIWSRKGETTLWEKVPIALNDMLDLFQQSSSGLQQKVNSAILQVQTSKFGIGANSKQAETSFGKKTAQNIDRIKNNPLAVNVTLLMIYWEVIPLMINVGPITLWDMFKTLCTGTTVAEFNGILFKASRKTLEFTQAYFNEKIFLVDEKSDEVNAWKEKQETRKMDRQGYTVTAYP